MKHQMWSQKMMVSLSSTSISASSHIQQSQEILLIILQFNFQPNNEMNSGRNLFASMMFVFYSFAEDFQEQETKFSGKMCQQEMLEEYIPYCEHNFLQAMASFNLEDWCVLKDIIGYESLPLKTGVSNSNTVK